MYPTVALANNIVAMPLAARVRLPVAASAVLYKVPTEAVSVKSPLVLLTIVTASPAAKTLLGIVTVPLARICLPASAATRV